MKAANKSSSYPPLADNIIHEVYRIMELLRADKQLLAFIGSWNETLPDKDVLEGLQFWIKLNKTALRQRSKSAKPSRQTKLKS